MIYEHCINALVELKFQDFNKKGAVQASAGKEPHVLSFPHFISCHLKQRELEIKSKPCRLPVIDKLYINGESLFKTTTGCDN